MKEKIIRMVINNLDCDYEEAIEIIKDTAEELVYSDPWEAMDIMRDNLGLDPDYIPELMDFIF